MKSSFDTILERITTGDLYSFPGGVHPEDKKALSNTTPVVRISLPDLITVPLRQHVGIEGTCCVEVGDYVHKGQKLTLSNHPYAVPIHAPTSGEVVAIGPHVVAHPSGLTEICVSLKPDGKEAWGEVTALPNYAQHPVEKVIEHLCDAGIAGMGGAGFPAHIKASASKQVEFLIINGAECEPYITSDDRLMRDYAWQIRQGIDVLNHLVRPKVVVIAIEDNKPEALEAMQIVCQDKENYHVLQVETKYPAGGEKQLIQMLTGREVPRSGLPADIGVLMFNVGTSYAIADAIFKGKPLIERIVTITGEAVEKPGNYWVPVGTPVYHLLGEAGYLPKKQSEPRVIMGGPMMGFTLSDADVPVVKITNCLLIPATGELRDTTDERACIRCSACSDACPATLLPQQLYWHAKARELDKAEQYNLFDCIECGACAYVCPSDIPLVHYYRQAKAEIRLQRDEKNKAEKARERFEARKARLEQEKLEREARHQKAKAARQAVASGTDDSPKDKVAAALARANAKRQAAQAGESEHTADSPKSAQVAAAVARAKAKKAQQAEQTVDDAQAEEANLAPSSEVEKKDRVAAAVARAKARKAQQAEHTVDDAQTEAADSTPSPEAEKKDRVAAAVARAKAKKAQQAEHTVDDAQTEAADSTPSPEAEKKDRVAAAVARAKAKKAQQAEQTVDDAQTEKANSAPSPEDEKKARVAAAVAKAKAKREKDKVAAQPQTENDSDSDSEQSEKQKRIAAAVAKAKAKREAKQADNDNAGDAAATDEQTEKQKRIAAAVAKAKAKRDKDSKDTPS